VAVSPIFWQRNLNLCGSPRSSSESRRPLDVISVCTRPGQHVTDRIGPYQPQVPGAEFGLGVRWRLALTSIGVPGPSLGNPPVVVFSLGLGGVPGEGPVAPDSFEPVGSPRRTPNTSPTESLTRRGAPPLQVGGCCIATGITADSGKVTPLLPSKVVSRHQMPTPVWWGGGHGTE